MGVSWKKVVPPFHNPSADHLVVGKPMGQLGTSASSQADIAKGISEEQKSKAELMTEIARVTFFALQKGPRLYFTPQRVTSMDP